MPDKYVVDASNNVDAYILELKEDGTYRKIGTVWNIEDAVALAALANSAFFTGSYEKEHG